MTTKKERKAALVAVVTAALKQAPPEVDRKFVKAAIMPIIEQLLQAHEDELVAAQVQNRERDLRPPFRDEPLYGNQKRGQLLTNFTGAIASTNELQDFIRNLRTGYDARRFAALPDDHALQFGRNWEAPTWRGFPGSAYLLTGMKWYVLLCRSRKWALASMLLRFLFQVGLELYALSPRYAEGLKRDWQRRYEKDFSWWHYWLRGRAEGQYDDEFLLKEAKSSFKQFGNRVRVVATHGQIDRSGKEWLFCTSAKDDLGVALMTLADWDSPQVKRLAVLYDFKRHRWPEHRNSLREELHEIVGFPSMEAVRYANMFEEPDLLWFLDRLRTREELEAFRADPQETYPNLGQRQYEALLLQQLDWLDGLDELALFEAAAGERDFPNLNLPHSPLIEALAAEAKDAEKAGKKARKTSQEERTANPSTGFGALLVGAALGAGAYALLNRGAA